VRPHSDLPAFRPGMDEHPDDEEGRRLIFADFLDIECNGDPRGPVVRAACAIREHVGDVAFPDRFDTFWTQSEGWETVGKRLEAMAAHPENTAVFRNRYHRLVRGDVPLDPEQLESTLRLQYDLQVRLLESLNLLEEDEDGERCLTAIDGKRYPLPSIEEVLARMQTPELQTKLRQGFDTLLLVPFGLPLERFLDAWRQGLRCHATTLRGVGAFNEADPLDAWEQYHVEPLVYEPRSFVPAVHDGRPKEDILVAEERNWDVLLVEGAILDLPCEGQGQTIGGRRQLECGQSPAEHLLELQRRGEIGLMPEAYVVQFLDALERRGQVLDVQTFSSLPGSFLPVSRCIPGAFWDSRNGRAVLVGDETDYHLAYYGVRAAVRVM
jgi:hypothetical protein